MGFMQCIFTNTCPYSELLCIVLPPCIVILHFCFQSRVVCLCITKKIKNELEAMDFNVMIYVIGESGRNWLVFDCVGV